MSPYFPYFPYFPQPVEKRKTLFAPTAASSLCRDWVDCTIVTISQPEIRSSSPCKSFLGSGKTTLGDPFLRFDSHFLSSKMPSFLTRTIVSPAYRVARSAREMRFCGRMAFWRGTMCPPTADAVGSVPFSGSRHCRLQA